MAPRRVVVSGCSGGGKSTLLEALGYSGWPVVNEPGRRIVRAARAGEVGTLPWDDPAGFAREALALALSDLRGHATTDGWVFFDRGAFDAASALDHVTGGDALADITWSDLYWPLVFLVPPWRDIYAQDPERQHGFAAAQAEYARLVRDYARLGFDTVIVPRQPVVERSAFVLERLGIG